MGCRHPHLFPWFRRFSVGVTITEIVYEVSYLQQNKGNNFRFENQLLDLSKVPERFISL